MLVAGQEWSSQDGRSAVRVIEVSSERSVVERLLRPGSGKAGAHIHRDWTQRFEVHEGEVIVRVDNDAPRALAAGDSVEVPRGVGHIDPWNESAEPAVTRNVVSPVTPFPPRHFRDAGRVACRRSLELSGQPDAAADGGRTARRSSGQLG